MRCPRLTRRHHSGYLLLPQALRTMIYLSTTLLFLPVSLSLARVLSCAPGGVWEGTGLDCWQPGHTVLAVVGCLAFLVFVVIAMTGRIQPPRSPLALRCCVRRRRRWAPYGPCERRSLSSVLSIDF